MDEGASPETGSCHQSQPRCPRREQPAQPLCLIRSDTPGPPRFEELPQTFVTEALDRHSLYVACSVTDYKPTISEQPASLSSPRAWRPSDLAPTSAFARAVGGVSHPLGAPGRLGAFPQKGKRISSRFDSIGQERRCRTFESQVVSKSVVRSAADIRRARQDGPRFSRPSGTAPTAVGTRSSTVCGFTEPMLGHGAPAKSVTTPSAAQASRRKHSPPEGRHAREGPPDGTTQASTRTTQLYDRREDRVSLDEVVKISIRG